MTQGPPSLLAIDHDDYHAEHVGRTADGRQFFLTTPFEPATRDGDADGCEYVALFVFDAAGALLDARIDSFGPRATLDHDARLARRDELLAELGDVRFERIEIAPFEVERFGTTFGLIARPGEEPDDAWWVELLPGNYMAFTEPWDSGEYDT